MNPYQSAAQEILRQYERTRDQNLRQRRERTAEIHAKIPRVAEIDQQLPQSAVAVYNQILQKTGDGEALARQLAERNRQLAAEKEQLLRQAGYPADYLAEIFTCPDCRDTGYLPDGGRCHCFRQKLIDRNYALSNLAEVLERENFGTFDFRWYSPAVSEADGLSPRDKMRLIYQACLDFVANFDSAFENLLFYGEPGLGKTFLCNCIAKALLDQGRTVLYLTAPRLFRRVEDLRFRRDPDALEEPDGFAQTLQEVDLLVIDDLGAEFATVVTSAEFFNIINTRLIDRKSTVISTNLAPHQFENQYSERVISRFFGSYKMMRLIGEDIRVKKKYEGIN